MVRPVWPEFDPGGPELDVRVVAEDLPHVLLCEEGFLDPGVRCPADLGAVLRVL